MNGVKRERMASIARVCLILNTFLAAEVWAPTHLTEPKADVIVKDGHRVVAVEYGEEGKPNTKILISPPDPKHVEAEDGTGKGVFGKTISEEGGRHADATPGQLLFDASGDKNPNTLGKANDRISRVPEETKEKARDAVRGRVIPAKVGSVVGLMGLATAYGTCVWVTFVASYVLAGVMGRHQFGLVQSKVYPLYFKAVSLGILVGLLGHVLDRRRRLLTDAADMFEALNLMGSLLMVEGNAAFVEPRATKAMFERMKAEKEQGRRTEGEVRERLKKHSDRLQRMNTYSSWLNTLTLMSLTWHLVYLGHRLSFTC